MLGAEIRFIYGASLTLMRFAAAIVASLRDRPETRSRRFPPALEPAELPNLSNQIHGIRYGFAGERRPFCVH